MQPGLYDHLLTKEIEAKITQLGDQRLAQLSLVDVEESHSVVAQYLERVIASSLSLYRGTDASEKQAQLATQIVSLLSETLLDKGADGYSIATPLQRLLAIHRTTEQKNSRPDTPLARST